MFAVLPSTIDNLDTTLHDLDEQVTCLEAFQGDLALIETVNELNQLRETASNEEII